MKTVSAPRRSAQHALISTPWHSTIENIHEKKKKIVDDYELCAKADVSLLDANKWTSYFQCHHHHYHYHHDSDNNN